MSTFRMVAYIIVATVVMIALCRISGNGAFTTTSPLLVVALSVSISVVAFLFYAGFATVLCLSCGYSHPGVIWITVLATIAGAISLRLLSFYFPHLLVFPTLLGAFPYAVFNTLLVWGLGYISGVLKTGLPSLGPRK